jgi:ATP-dependent RNA helicase SUPV3L1/SUV3
MKLDSELKKEYSKTLKDKLNFDWFSENDVKYFIHVGKTNSGKTYNSIKRLKEVGSGVYLAPLRLLAWEVYETLNSENYRCNLVTGEEQMTSENAKITASTIEMMDYSNEHEVVVVDEAFMIGDKDRGKSWLKAILNTKAKEIHIITNEEALELISTILELTNRKFEVKKYERLQSFKFAETEFRFSKQMPKRGVFVTFSRIDVLINKVRLENLGHSVSILYGNLPPEVKKQQISQFIEGKSDFIITTDVIGMGLNIPCDYLVFLEIEKYDGVQNRKLNPVEIKQIAGRTGRYGISSQDAFVSSTSKNKLNYIKSNYGVRSLISVANIGMDYEMFCSFPEETSIYLRLRYFKEADFIPLKLKKLVQKEDIAKYLEIHSKVDNDKFDLKTKWAFLTAPVKNNNRDYFYTCINYYSHNTILPKPHATINTNDAKYLEDAISEIELYLNLSRHLKCNPEDKKYITEIKDLFVEKLTKVIMDKKLLSRKKCKLCTKMISITHPYAYCEACYKGELPTTLKGSGFG